MTRLRRLENRVYRAVRDPRSADPAGEEPRAWDVALLDGAGFCLLTSFRTDGRSVATPMWFGVADGRVHLRSEARDAKVRRILRDPRVLLCTCGVRGRPTGPVMAGRAAVLRDAGAVRAAEESLRGGNGAARRVYGMTRALILDPAYIEVRAPDA
ncbi:PPOX class F420-dependent oxidoreductase [Patulibacter minatonensis]|uniref:PPOX class F420-dependent oxidoreductase n=1 Tax=Patulibacter minatonensis TaxID=298163 RepID=UPI0004BC2859|nr:PPOX class F420-dependent oxidoreductase [Patulibacter minatonensis]